jgi:Rab3 GTPase-activating protein catalytic subunit
VSSLLQQPEVEVKGGAYGPAGSAIHKLFVAAQKAALMIMDDDDLDGAKDKTAADSLGAASSNSMSTPPSSSSSSHDFPAPSAREYILRAMVPRPAPFSRVLPQRMYCVMVDGDYRLAGAFSTDTTFQ